MNNLRVIWSTLCTQISSSLARPMFRFTLFVNPILNTILMYQMFRNSGQNNFATYIILGSGLMGMWSCICFSSAGDIQRERWYGTLSISFITPARFDLIIFGKILGNTIVSMLTLLLSFTTARLLFKITVVIIRPWFLILSTFLTIVCFIMISTTLAYLLTLSRKTDLYQNLIEIPFLLLCGFLFPIDILPNCILPLSYILPPTWAIKLLRLSINGVETTEFLYSVFILITVLICLFIINKILFSIIEHKIRVSATLEVS